MVISNGPNQNSIPNQNNIQNQNGGSPQNVMPNQGRTPPQEAVNACNGKSNGDYCSFTSPYGDMISGTCQIPPASSTLACIPH